MFDLDRPAHRSRDRRLRGRLLAALGAQAVVAAAAAGYRLAVSTDPHTGTTLADYLDVALISLFVAAYGAAATKVLFDKTGFV
jgi:hypothetical protein